MNEHTELLMAILQETKNQTAAINHLAMTNLKLIEVIAEAEGEEVEPTNYLDGSPIGEASCSEQDYLDTE